MKAVGVPSHEENQVGRGRIVAWDVVAGPTTPSILRKLRGDNCVL